MSDPHFGQLLREYRHNRGLTLEELGEASGISARTISDMERGRSRSPQRRSVVALADALELEGDRRRELIDVARAGRQLPSQEAPRWCDLPRPVNDFTGRATDLALIRSACNSWSTTDGDPRNVVLITGHGGLGKTTLAARAVSLMLECFPDGQFFVDLRGLDVDPVMPIDALHRLLRVLGVREQNLARSLEAASSQFRAELSRRQMAVIFDNAADEAQIRPLLPGPGPSMVIVTSRRLLTGIGPVTRLPLGALTRVESGELLRKILAASTSRSEPSDLDRLSDACGNLPLALRIAGNRLLTRPYWDARLLADKLAVEEHRLIQLTAGDLEVGAAFALSYAHLTAAAQATFRRMSVVTGASWDALIASQAVGPAVSHTEFVLDELVEAGLLQGLPADRFTQHDLMKLFARRQLADEESPEAIEGHTRRLINWLLEVTIVAGRCFEPGFGLPAAGGPHKVDLSTTEAAEHWLQTEGGNWLAALHAAAARGLYRRVVEVAESLHWFSDRWILWGHWHEVFGLSRRAAAELADPHLEAAHLNYLSWAQLQCLGEPGQALQSALVAADIARSVDDLTQLSWAESYAAQAYRMLGQLEQALEAAHRSADICARTGDHDGLSQALLEAAFILQAQHRHRDALAMYGDLQEMMNDPSTAPAPVVRMWTQAAMRPSASFAELREWPAADAAARAALDAAIKIDIPMLEARARLHLGGALLGQDQGSAAKQQLRQAFEMFTALDEGDLRQTAQRALDSADSSTA